MLILAGFLPTDWQVNDGYSTTLPARRTGPDASSASQARDPIDSSRARNLSRVPTPVPPNIESNIPRQSR